MTLTTQVSVGDLVLVVGLFVSVIANYSIQGAALKNLKNQVEDLRRGRGLILGDNSDWPPAVRRCFGYYDNGPHRHRPE